MPWNVPAQLSASFMMSALSPRTLRAIRSTRIDISDAAPRERHQQNRQGSAPLTIRWRRGEQACWSCRIPHAMTQEGSPDMTVGTDAVLDGSTLLRIETSRSMILLGAAIR